MKLITMKLFTDLEQSKKLAEILPLESADMHYNNVSVRGVNYVDDYRAELMDYNTATKVLSKYSINPLFGVVPCWSLAALLGVLPEINGVNLKFERVKAEDGYDGYYYHIEYENKILIPYSKNPVDACVEMIIKLYEQKIL